MKILAILILWCFVSAVSSRGQEPLEAPLGFPVTITDLYIPGPKAQPIPRKDRDGSLVIRVLEIKPAADGFRYDFEVYGLDPGTHILADYLQYEDGKPIEKLDFQVNVTTKHALDTLPKPQELTLHPPAKLGGYRVVATLLGILWAIAFLLILFYRKRQPATEPPAPPPPTLHEKLTILVHTAAERQLSEDQRAQLERLIVGHWKQKLPELAAISPSAAIRELRTHPEASPLLLKLEEWLHSPQSSASQTDINQLLEPFR